MSNGERAFNIAMDALILVPFAGSAARAGIKGTTAGARAISKGVGKQLGTRAGQRAETLYKRATRAAERGDTAGFKAATKALTPLIERAELKALPPGATRPALTAGQRLKALTTGEAKPIDAIFSAGRQSRPKAADDIGKALEDGSDLTKARDAQDARNLKEAKDAEIKAAKLRPGTQRDKLIERASLIRTQIRERPRFTTIPGVEVRPAGLAPLATRTKTGALATRPRRVPRRKPREERSTRPPLDLPTPDVRGRGAQIPVKPLAPRAGEIPRVSRTGKADIAAESLSPRAPEVRKAPRPQTEAGERLRSTGAGAPTPARPTPAAPSSAQRARDARKARLARRRAQDRARRLERPGVRRGPTTGKFKKVKPKGRRAPIVAPRITPDAASQQRQQAIPGVRLIPAQATGTGLSQREAQKVEAGERQAVRPDASTRVDDRVTTTPKTTTDTPPATPPRPPRIKTPRDEPPKTPPQRPPKTPPKKPPTPKLRKGKDPEFKKRIPLGVTNATVVGFNTGATDRIVDLRTGKSRFVRDDKRIPEIASRKSFTVLERGKGGKEVTLKSGVSTVTISPKDVRFGRGKRGKRKSAPRAGRI